MREGRFYIDNDPGNEVLVEEVSPNYFEIWSFIDGMVVWKGAGVCDPDHRIKLTHYQNLRDINSVSDGYAFRGPTTIYVGGYRYLDLDRLGHLRGAVGHHIVISRQGGLFYDVIGTSVASFAGGGISFKTTWVRVD